MKTAFLIIGIVTLLLNATLTALYIWLSVRRNTAKTNTKKDIVFQIHKAERINGVSDSIKAESETIDI